MSEPVLGPAFEAALAELERARERGEVQPKSSAAIEALRNADEALEEELDQPCTYDVAAYLAHREECWHCDNGIRIETPAFGPPCPRYMEHIEHARTCPSCSPRSLPRSEPSADERAYLNRVWVAMMLAPTLEICEALLRGESVPDDRLDLDWLARFGFRKLRSV